MEKLFKKYTLPLIVLILLLGLSAIYVVTLTKNWSVDAIRYAYLVDNAAGIFSPLLYHPHHLLYSVSGFAVNKIAVNGASTILMLQLLNCIFAAIAVILLFVFLRTIGIKKLTALFFCLGLSFSYCFWHCATDIEPQISPLLFFMCMLILLIQLNKAKFPYLVSGLIGFLHGAAILFHQSSIFFTIPVLAGFFLMVSSKKKYRYMLLYLLFSAATSIAVYVLAAIFILQIATVKEFLIFVTYYGNIGIDGIKFFKPINFLRVAYTLFNLIFYIPLATLRKFAQNIFSYNGLLSIAAFTLTAFFYALPFAPAFKPKLSPIKKKMRIIAVIWACVYAIYIIFGAAPYAIEQYINIALPVWILFAIFADSFLLQTKHKKPAYMLTIIMIALIFLWNYSLFVRGSVNIANNSKYKNAFFWKGRSEPGDIFLSFGWNPYLEHFAKRKVITIGDYFPSEREHLKTYNNRFHRIIKERIATGGSVFILGYDSILKDKHARDYMQKISQTYTMGNIRNFFSQYKLKPIKIYSNVAHKIEVE